MILSQRNWDYNKNFQVELCANVQASQVNVPTNKKPPRTLDVINLFPATNFQGGHQIMDLQTEQLIARPKVIEINITCNLQSAKMFQVFN